MKAYVIGLAVIILALATLTPSYAACSNACSSAQYTCSLSTSSMTKGTSGTLTSSVTNQQSQSQSSVTATIQGSWFSGETTSQVISSINSGEAKSLDFTITPNSDGSNDVCIDMGGTCTADCGQITINSAADLSVVSLTSSDSDNSVSPSASFTVSATIQNTGTETAGSTTSVVATLADSNGKCTIADASRTIVTIAGLASSSQSWSVSAGSATGTCAFTLTTTGTPGGTGTGTLSVTIASTTTTTTVAGGGSPSGGGGGSSLTKAKTPEGTTVKTVNGETVIKIPSTAKNVEAGIDVDSPAETGIRRIAFVPSSDLANVSITIKKISASPVGAPIAEAYGYIQIEFANVTDAKISSAEIAFQVEKSWLSSKGYANDRVRLSRYANQWNELSTQETGSDDANVFYNAKTPGFSVFAITAVKATMPPPQPIEKTVGDVTKKAQQIWNTYGWYIALATLAVALIIGWIYYHGHSHIKEARYQFQKKYKI